MRSLLGGVRGRRLQARAPRRALVAQLMVILDITAVNIALPSVARDLESAAARSAGRSRATRSSSAASSFRRPRRRPARAAAVLTGLGIFTFLTCLGDGGQRWRPVRRSRGPGSRGSDPLPGGACDHNVRLPGRNQRAKALAAWGAVGGAGAAIGVLVGGVLTEFDWRLIFYVNLPVAAALAIAALKIIPADTQKPRWKGLDLRGAVLRNNESRRDRLLGYPGRERR